MDTRGTEPDKERWRLLWAKTCRDDPSRYHPLLFHMLDVASVAGAMWDLWLPAALKKRLAAALGIRPDQARSAVICLAGLHDLGKACPAFQGQVSELAERVGLPGMDQGSCPKSRPPHGFVSTRELIDRFACGGFGWEAPPEPAYCLAAITGGHHGVFPTSYLLDRTDYHARDPRDEEEWAAARDALIKEFLRLAIPGEAGVATLHTAALADSGSVPLLAGFISVADWIGSAQKVFQPSARLGHPVPDACVYARTLPVRAKGALEAFGWLPVPTSARPAAIDEVFGYLEDFSANLMQRTVARIAASETGPLLLVVEDAMGRGKSEAALYVFDRAFAEGRTHGLYVALPTMATGNAMFARVRKYLETRGHGGALNLQLIHSGAVLHEAFREVLLASVNPGEEEGVSTVAAASWFTERKRPLLAPFGAGTIDQSLLGVLQTRHWFVRLFALAGKVVVFDEVHSYDAYMLAELHLLIRWLKELGCTVVILSATLPEDKRAELIRAWGTDPPAQPKSYPRVTWVAGEACRDEHVGEESELDRTVEMDRRPSGADTLLDLVRVRLPAGGCGVVICNTVDRAQAVFRQVRGPLGKEGWRVLLHHARTPMVWREEAEEDVRRYLGKNGDRTQATLVIGTQVLEQSLDYDADWMASDIAPVDLLLQRMGRLWRHLRKGRPVSVPRFDVLTDATDDRDQVPVFANAPEVIYARYLILRTWLEIRGLSQVRLPADIEPLVKSVYSDPQPGTLAPAWKITLDETARQMERAAAKSTAKLRGGDTADRSCLAPAPVENGRRRRPVRILDVASRQLDDDEDPALHETVRALTRDARPSVQVVCLGAGEEGEPLPTRTSGRVTLDVARCLLKHGLTIQHQQLFEALVATEVPSNWRKSAHLHFARPLHFVGGRCEVAGFALRLNRREGLAFERLSSP